MREAELADGTILEFPDNTPDDVMQNTVKKYLNPKPPTISEQVGKMGDAAMGLGEAALAVGSGAIGGLAGGLTFLPAAATHGVDVGLASKKLVEDTLQYQPISESGQNIIKGAGDFVAPYAEKLENLSQGMGEGVFQEVGDSAFPAAAPVLATAEYMAPQIILEAASLFTGGGLSRMLKAKSLKNQAKGEKLELDAQRILEPEKIVDYEGAADTLKKANPEDIAVLINSDAGLLDSLEELGLGDQALASYSSQNPQFRAIEQGLASLDASPLNQQQKKFFEDLAQKADDLIVEYGGTLDKADLSATIKADMLKTIDDMYEAEDLLYRNISQKIPNTTEIEASSTLAYIENLAQDVGGIDKLDGKIQKLYRDLKPTFKTEKGKFSYSSGKQQGATVVQNPRYGLLSDRRRDIGQQLGRKGDTQFRDVEIGKLKGLYAAMKRDQKSAIEATGDKSLINLQERADINTIQRKKLEGDTVDLLGKGLDKELINVLGKSIKGLGEGNLQNFNRTIDQIPKKHRQGAIITAMNNVFKGTAASKQQLGDAQFAKFWTQLNRSPKVKEALFKELPPESRKAISNLGDVTNAVYKANQDKITTGRIDSFLDDRSGVVNTLANNLVAPVGGFVVSKMGGGPVGGAAFKMLIEGSTDKAKAANMMLADSKFKQMVRQATKDGVVDGQVASAKLKASQELFGKSKTFKKWADTLEPENKALVARVGIMNYLLRPRPEQQEDK